MAIIPVAQGQIWPSGEYQVVALLSADDAWISNAFQQPLFSGDEPGLGPWVGAGGLMPSGELIEVVRYTLSPVTPQFELRIDARSRRESAILEFVRETGIPESALDLGSGRKVDG